MIWPSELPYPRSPIGRQLRCGFITCGLLKIPNIFALLPTRFADSYFSMDLLVQESAMCLGGPNFNNATVKDSMLLRLGFDEGERKMIHVIKCNNSMDGWSAQIYKRILKLARISLGLNIGFTLIFSVILRKRPLPMPASLYVFWSAMGISAIKFSYLRWLCSFRTRISDGRRQLKNAVHFLS